MRAKSIAISVLVAAFSNTLARPAITDDEPIAVLRDMYDRAPLRIGPLKLLPQLYISNAGVDSNVYGTTLDPVSDFTFTAGPVGTFYLRTTKRLLLSVYESPRYVYFNDQESLRAWNNELAVRQYVALNRFMLTFTGSSINARERFGSEVEIRPRRHQNAGEGSIYWRTARRTSMLFRARVVDFSYSSDKFETFVLKALLDRREKLFTATFYYQLFPKTKWFTEGEVGRYDFDNPLSGRDGRSGGIYTGLEFQPDAALSGRVRLGWKRFEPDRAGAPVFTGLAGEALISHRFFDRYELRGRYSRDTQFSVWFGNVYYIEERKGVGGTAHIFHHLRVQYDYARGSNTYSVDIGPLSRLDRFQTHEGRVIYRFRQSWDLGLSASRWARDSSIIGQSDSRTLWGFYLAYNDR